MSKFFVRSAKVVSLVGLASLSLLPIALSAQAAEAWSYKNGKDSFSGSFPTKEHCDRIRARDPQATEGCKIWEFFFETQEGGEYGPYGSWAMCKFFQKDVADSVVFTKTCYGREKVSQAN